MSYLIQLLPIVGLLALVVVVVTTLPKVNVGHSSAYMKRRFLNWFPLGMTYAFLYMGRYNITVAKSLGAITVEEYGGIFAVGALVYGVSFLINGPLADKYGGRKTILAAASGSSVMNVLMGFVILSESENKVLYLTILTGANMYFQSFGAVSIVKVNSAWFHVRERGTFGGIFGVLISLGVYFAYDWGKLIGEADVLGIQWMFFIPAGILATFFVIDFFIVRDLPSDTGHDDFDTADASSGDDGPAQPVLTVMKRMFTNPIILTIAFIEFCSGFLRNAIMQWYRSFASGVGLEEGFVYQNWGLLLCCAGIVGGMFAGLISDRVFQSRRGPVSAVLYAFMLIGALVAIPFVTGAPVYVGPIVVFMSMSIIGVHGMLSGTASQDFGGKKNAGVAVGIIDGFVYLGTGLQSFVLGKQLPEKGTAAAAELSNWTIWFLIMVPFIVVGLVLTLRIWNAKPKPKQKPPDVQEPESATS